MPSDQPLIYRVPEVARLLGCTEAVVRQMIARGQIPSRRLGRRVVVLADELHAHMKALKRPGYELDAPEHGANCPKEVRR
jgi:excisionase family DNA binding protein